MILFVKNLLFANWRNKGIALFFAASIWFVAFQSETRQLTVSVAATVLPVNENESVVLSVQTREQEGGEPETFLGEISLVLTGPRKQIEELRNDAGRGFPVTFRVPIEDEVFVFREDEFAFLPAGVSIKEMRPAAVRVRQEPVRERIVENLSDLVLVSEYDPGFVVSREVLSPGQIRVRGPQSLIDAVGIEIPIALRYTRREVSEHAVSPRFHGVDRALIDRTIQVRPEADSPWFAVNQAPQVRVRVSLAKSVESWSADSVEVFFQLPLTKRACRVVLNDVPEGGNRIPVKFSGPPDQIEALRNQQRITVLAPPPANFEVEKGGTYTFTEDALRLYGFPGVRISQHESREKERQNAWSYEVIVTAEK